MKIIFLDVDGVLNNDNHIYKYGSNYIDNNLLNLLVALVKSTNAELVLSSTWRLFHEYKKIIDEKLSKFNIKILDSTPLIKHNRPGWISRSEEIKTWLNEHPQVSKFVILDDEIEAGEGFEENFHKTESSIGLTEDIAFEIIYYLNK